MLRIIENRSDFKKRFYSQFEETQNANPSLGVFIKESFNIDTLFIVGGYIRSLINWEEPRDIDIIANFDKDTLSSLIKKHFGHYSENRLGGFKVQLEHINMDVWSIEDNWAFKWNLVKNAHVNFVEKIAEGTFFNFDSLVVDLKTFNYSLRHYNYCSGKKALDIIQRNSKYKKLNPTKEANILRAFYLKEKYSLEFSAQLNQYLKEQLEYIEQTSDDRISRLSTTLSKYRKYNDILDAETISKMINDIFALPGIKNEDKPPQQELF